MKDLLKKVFKRWELFLVVFLVLEFVVFGSANPKFLRPQSIMNSIVNYISVCIKILLRDARWKNQAETTFQLQKGVY